MWLLPGALPRPEKLVGKTVQGWLAAFFGYGEGYSGKGFMRSHAFSGDLIVCIEENPAIAGYRSLAALVAKIDKFRIDGRSRRALSVSS